MIEKFATRFCSVMNGYDGTASKFEESKPLLQEIYDELEEYKPRKNGACLLKRMLMKAIREEYHRIDDCINRQRNM